MELALRKNSGRAFADFWNLINAHVLVIRTCGAFGENTIIVGYVVVSCERVSGIVGNRSSDTTHIS